MVRRLYPWMFLVGGIVIGLVASGRIVLLAQARSRVVAPDDARPQRARTEVPQAEVPTARAEASVPAGREPARIGTGSVQDVLLRPYPFPFGRPTSLTQVCIHLRQTLGVPVVLDLAALERQDVDPQDTVQLELDGVRLKTGLKLLLDQVRLTYQLVPEDNLLVITDRQGSEDPLDRIWTELRTLHRDLHDVQDAVDELGDALYGQREDGPRVRKPTIIEEMPDGDPFPQQPAERGTRDPKATDPKPGSGQPPIRPGGVRPTPSRIPLASPRGSL
jgi:hypothetical protein